jgi:hypothetical protein
MGIIFFDQILMEFPIELTIFKVLVVSLLHVLFVMRTKYVYNSDIYIYLSDLKKAREECFIIKPLLSDLQSGILFWLSFVLFLGITYFGLGQSNLLNGLLLLCFSTLLLNGFNEILRNLTNKAELSRVAVPPSLQQRRFMPTIAQFGAKAAPLCGNALRTVGAGIGISEVALPFVTGGPNNIGPITRWATNKMYAGNKMTCPINTRLDVMAEHAWNVNQQNIDAGLLKQHTTSKRMYSLTTPSQLAQLGVGSFPK